jgi:hypothetical protein
MKKRSYYRAVFLCVAILLISSLGCFYQSQAKLQEGAGPYPVGIRAWNKETKAAQQKAAKQLLKDLQMAIDDGQKVFCILPGHYRFARDSDVQRIVISDIDGMQIEAKGVTFWFDLESSLILRNCSNVTLSGLTIDYDPLPFTQGTITALDKNKSTLDVRLDDGYQTLEHIGLSDMPSSGDGGVHIRYFDPTSEHLIKIPWEAATAMQKLGDACYRISLMNNRLNEVADHPKMVTPGFRVSVNQHGEFPIDLYNCGNVTLEDVTIYASPSVAVYERFGSGGNTYRRMRCVRKPETNRMMVSTRDMFHSYGMKKGPLIEDCELSYCGDDMIAIHSFFSLVAEQQAPDRLLMVTPFECDISEGTKLDFFDFKTSEPLASAEVVRLKVLPERKSDLPKEVYCRLENAGFKTRNFVDETTVVLVELDRPVGLRELTCAQCYDRCGSGAVIRNNLIYEGTMRGIFPRSRDILIENNRIERIGGPGIIHMPDNHWFEGVFTYNSRIVNNTVVDCGWAMFGSGFAEPFPGAIHIGAVFGQSYYPHTFFPYVHNHHITIENNRIIRPAAQGIFLANTRDSIVRNNVIEQPFSKPYGLEELNFSKTSEKTIPEAWKNDPDMQKPYYGIFVISAQRIVLENNKIIDGPEYLRGDIGLGPWTEEISVNKF